MLIWHKRTYTLNPSRHVTFFFKKFASGHYRRCCHVTTFLKIKKRTFQASVSRHLCTSQLCDGKQHSISKFMIYFNWSIPHFQSSALLWTNLTKPSLPNGLIVKLCHRLCIGGPWNIWNGSKEIVVWMDCYPNLSKLPEEYQVLTSSPQIKHGIETTKRLNL